MTKFLLEINWNQKLTFFSLVAYRNLCWVPFPGSFHLIANRAISLRVLRLKSIRFEDHSMIILAVFWEMFFSLPLKKFVKMLIRLAVLQYLREQPNFEMCFRCSILRIFLSCSVVMSQDGELILISGWIEIKKKQRAAWIDFLFI